MKALTLRNLPAEVARAVQRRAKEQGISLNRAVIRLLEEALGCSTASPSKPKRIYHDLDAWIGSMSKEQADEMERILREDRKIDQKIWQ